MELKIGICDSDLEWHERVVTILKKMERITGISRELEHFYGEKDILFYSGIPMDLLFLSVELKDGNGITLAKQINRIWPECQIIFVAQDLSGAVKAYETTHVYYIVKEEAETLIEKALDRALEMVISGMHQRSKKVLLSVIGGEQVLAAVNEILYFERRKRVTEVITTVGTYEIWDKLDTLEHALFPEEFVRCHSSYIIYLPAVRAVEGNSFLMQNGSWIPISRGYQKIVKRYVDTWVRSHAMTTKNLSDHRVK